MKRPDRPVVGVVYPLAHHDVATMLRDAAVVAQCVGDDPESIAEVVHRVDGLIARGPAPITAEHIRNSDRLRVIAVTGSGVNHIDLDAATAHGIPVISGAGVAPYAVAEYVIGAMIAGRRNVFGFHRMLVGNNVDWQSRVSTGSRPGLRGATIGLVGFGSIAREVGRMANDAFRAHVLAYDPLLTTAPDSRVELVKSLDDLLDRSSIVSVHVPLTAATHGLIGPAELRRIGPEGMLVNTSRGGVVDEIALLDALTQGALGGAFVDVFDPEPPGPEQLARFDATPNLIVTPHIAGITIEGRRALEAAAVVEVLSALRGDRPARVVNPEVFSPVRVEDG